MSKDELVLPRKINIANAKTFERTAEEFSGDTFNMLRKLKERMIELNAGVTKLNGEVNALEQAVAGIVPFPGFGAPSQGIGGGNAAGVSPLVAHADHDHALRETSGPTDLRLGDILNGEIWRRTSGNILGRTLLANSTGGTASSSVVTPADVSANLTFALKDTAPAVFYVLWVVFYITAAATTGLMLSVNFTGGTTAGNDRFGVLMATGAGTTFSAYSTVFDTLLGTPTAGPGGTGRVAIMFCRTSVSAAGTIALRYASGVAGSSVSIGAQSFGIVLQQ